MGAPGRAPQDPAPGPSPLVLDDAGEELSFRGRRVRLRSKTFAVLRHLAGRPRQLVTRAELLRAVWKTTHVSPTVLKVCVAEARKALRSAAGADAAPRLLAVRGRGYRFVPDDEGPGAALGRAATCFGRAAELGRLESHLARALGGQRQVVFVAGEAGIGKTTLVESFTEYVERRFGGGAAVACGRCVQRYGAREAFMPVLEALGQLARGPAGARFVAVLRRYAPIWLAQWPSVLEEAERERLQAQLLPATPQHALRLLCEALEAWTAETPSVLALEDLHWTDEATLDLIALLAERSGRARLLVLGSHREGDPTVDARDVQGLKQRLEMHGRAHELRLGPLPREAAAEYVAHRAAAEPPPALVDFLHRRSEGNPFFMVGILDYLLDQRLVVAGAHGLRLEADLGALERVLPRRVRDLIERQIEALDGDSLRVLEAGSVVGIDFSTGAVAAALDLDPAAVESACGTLARRGQFLRVPGPTEEQPQRALGPRYVFAHALQQLALYERVPESLRRTLHQRAAERLEAAYGPRAGEIAADLAEHFERSRDYVRAVTYLRQAAGNALRRAAVREALGYLEREAALLDRIEDAAERAGRELPLQIDRAGLLLLTRGTVPEVERAYLRALELCAARDATGHRFAALSGLYTYCVNTAQVACARALAEKMLALAASGKPGASLAVAHGALGIALHVAGELAASRGHLELATAAKGEVIQGFLDVGVVALGSLAYALAHLGHPRQALEETRRALATAQALGNPFNVAHALYSEIGVRQALGDVQGVARLVEEALSLLTEHGFQLFRERLVIMQGWTLARQGRAQEGLEHMLAGLRAMQSVGQRLARPHFLALLAEACASTGERARALRLLDEAFDEAGRTGELRYEPELHAVKGELLASAPESDRPDSIRAEACLREAVTLARRRSARLFELRAALSWARLLRRQRREVEARDLLAPVCAAFTDGVDPADLRDARALLAEIER